MKTSNKILLAFFLTCILILTAVYAAMYAKYRNGDYAPIGQAEKGHFIRHILKGINYVSITGLEKINIAPADTAELEVEDENNSRLQFSIMHDTLFINGDSLAKRKQYENGLRNFEMINLYLPETKNIIASFSKIRLSGSKDPVKAPSFDLQLVDHSEILPKEFYMWPVGGGYFNRLNIRAGLNSDILLSPTFNIKELNVDLEETGFSDGGATIDNITVIADKKSTIKLTGSNLPKADVHPKK